MVEPTPSAMFTQIQSTLKDLRLDACPGRDGDTRITYEQNVVGLIGQNLALLYRSCERRRPLEWTSNGFRLSALHSLETLVLYDGAFIFSEGANELLRWAISCFSIGTSHNYPFSKLSITFPSRPSLTEPMSQTSADLWIQLDIALESFKHLTRVRLHVIILCRTLEEMMDAQGKQRDLLRTLLPRVAKRNDVLVIDHMLVQGRM
ncbi:hypothetical protein DL96DRAFT_1585219 [Flagelloscypha sp. PMI_526]|nr:hypothetical protein DL96DRAFT_1585219 [Flagelloscypha sp. PMI_526]